MLRWKTQRRAHPNCGCDGLSRRKWVLKTLQWGCLRWRLEGTVLITTTHGNTKSSFWKARALWLVKKVTENLVLATSFLFLEMKNISSKTLAKKQSSFFASFPPINPHPDLDIQPIWLDYDSQPPDFAIFMLAAYAASNLKHELAIRTCLA